MLAPTHVVFCRVLSRHVPPCPAHDGLNSPAHAFYPERDYLSARVPSITEGQPMPLPYPSRSGARVRALPPVPGIWPTTGQPRCHEPACKCHGTSANATEHHPALPSQPSKVQTSSRYTPRFPVAFVAFLAKSLQPVRAGFASAAFSGPQSATLRLHPLAVPVAAIVRVLCYTSDMRRLRCGTPRSTPNRPRPRRRASRRNARRRGVIRPHVASNRS